MLTMQSHVGDPSGTVEPSVGVSRASSPKPNRRDRCANTSKAPDLFRGFCFERAPVQTYGAKIVDNLMFLRICCELSDCHLARNFGRCYYAITSKKREVWPRKSRYRNTLKTQVLSRRSSEPDKTGGCVSRAPLPESNRR
jgi:hypothetical protein